MSGWWNTNNNKYDNKYDCREIMLIMYYVGGPDLSRKRGIVKYMHIPRWAAEKPLTRSRCGLRWRLRWAQGLLLEAGLDFWKHGILSPAGPRDHVLGFRAMTLSPLHSLSAKYDIYNPLRFRPLLTSKSDCVSGSRSWKTVANWCMFHDFSRSVICFCSF